MEIIMHNNEKWKIITRFLSNECTDEERKQVSEWMAKDPELRKTIADLKQVWNIKETPIPADSLDRVWHSIRNQIEFDPVDTPRKEQPDYSKIIHWSKRYYGYVTKVYKYAAVFLLIILSSYFLSHGFTKFPWDSSPFTAKQEQYKTLTVENGQRIKITLSDGTRISLDSGSELKYPPTFGESRKVYLSGEAFFDVVHDPDRPFQVIANHARIQVLGTKFNIRAWQENPTVSVVVADGKVSLRQKDVEDKKTVIIRRGNKSELPRGKEPSMPVTVEVDQYLGWMKNEIRFKNASVNEVLAQLQRWYDFKYQVHDSLVLNQRVSVHIKKTNVDDVLQLISIITNTDIKKHGEKISIRQKISNNS
ncbi:DUF4974 domain-containing protein [candidate division KSB1 bacterium]|nr:DUF4974 domain-containing protein [candidate division KSB1 bacterium]